MCASCISHTYMCIWPTFCCLANIKANSQHHPSDQLVYVWQTSKPILDIIIVTNLFMFDKHQRQLSTSSFFMFDKHQSQFSTSSRWPTLLCLTNIKVRSHHHPSDQLFYVWQTSKPILNIILVTNFFYVWQTWKPILNIILVTNVFMFDKHQSQFSTSS